MREVVRKQIQKKDNSNTLGRSSKEMPKREPETEPVPHPAAPRFAYDFSRIPVRNNAPIILQPKFTISSPTDAYEQEADQIAHQVMRMSEPHQERVNDYGENPISRNKQLDRKRLQTKRVQANDTGDIAAPPIVHEALNSSGQPLDPATRAFFEPRFGYDFSRVRVHTDGKAVESARGVAAQAFTVGEHIVFGKSQYAPFDATGQHLLAHELTHVVQQSTGEKSLQRRAANCPAEAPKTPTIKTMDDFIALVRRVEESTPTGKDPIATARLISRTKYEGRAWDWMLPSTKDQAGAVTGGKVTADDIGSLCFKLVVSLPDGKFEDPMHIIAAIVSNAETLPAGTGATGLSRLVRSLPASVSQRSASTWVGDVGKAAAEWMSAHPLPNGGEEKIDYMLENAGTRDLFADVDAVAMTSKSAASGFAFDGTKPLSDNLQRFFTPAKRTGQERRFHIFCNVEGFVLEADGVTLTAGAKAAIGQRIKDFALWYQTTDPTLFKWHFRHMENGRMYNTWLKREGDWQWFANLFIKFLQNFLTKEGP
jgi:hypothetical protein